MSLPLCVRCGHPFERHRGWSHCMGCDCPGYSSVVPIARETVKLGDRLEVVGIARGGIPGAGASGVVTEIDAAGLVVQLEDGGERRFSWEQARTGVLRRAS